MTCWGHSPTQPLHLLVQTPSDSPSKEAPDPGTGSAAFSVVLNHPGTIHPCKFHLQSLPLTPPSSHSSPLPVRAQITPPGPALNTPADQPATARPDALHPCGVSCAVSGTGPVPTHCPARSALTRPTLRSSAGSRSLQPPHPQPGRLPEAGAGLKSHCVIHSSQCFVGRPC